MDIDFDSIVDFQILKNTSFFVSKAKLTPQNVANENGACINSTMKQMAQNGSAIPMFQVGDLYINSQDEMQYFPYIQKPMAGSNSLTSINEPNLRGPGDFFDHPDASQEDEPIIARRGRVESSEKENDSMYIVFNFRDIFNESSTTLVNPSPVTSINFDDEENTQQDNPSGLTELGIIHWTRDKHLIPDWLWD